MGRFVVCGLPWLVPAALLVALMVTGLAASVNDEVTRQGGAEESLREFDASLHGGALAFQTAVAKAHVPAVEQRVETGERTLPFPTLKQEDPELEVGLTRVVSPGRNGLVRVTRLLTYRDGQLIEAETLDETVLAEPQPRVVAYGTLDRITLGGKSLKIRRAMQAMATAYYPGPESTGRFADGLTATGLKAGRGVVAVDPRVIPLGSRLYVEEYGFAVAGDVGSAIKGNRIDLCFDTLEEALQFGRKQLKVYILVDDQNG